MNGCLQIVLLVAIFNLAAGNHVHDVEKELRLQGQGPQIGDLLDADGIDRKARRVHTDAELDKPKAERRVLTFMVSGRNLSADNKINPRLSLFYQTADSDLNKQETSRVYGNKNPDWTTVFTYNWIQGSPQKWEFKVKGTDETHIDSNSELSLGHVEVDVDTYVQNNENIIVDLDDGQGQLIIEKTKPLTFKLGAKNVATRDNFNGKSDPYVKCYWRRGPDGVDVYMGKTAAIDNVVDVEWMENLVFKGYQRGTDQFLHFVLYDEDGLSKDDFLGEAFLRLDALDMGSSEMLIKVVDLMNEGKRRGGPGNLVVKIFPFNSLASKANGRVEMDA